ncbi:MAG TPA: 1-phosphofructokinase family hexose kinase [Anaerolineaceae bacterium]|jgi:1-phosphofructokinase family hexose kinase|nr:1-phosphofructokinase family hexose kinase [Anaerolineaceae bacterium]HOO57744.1 1-phosphofructokinase family hexose kinase [Anaerolineaceae bacterium]HOR78523.1 1-phosphofructokinase family hexose kinase [Anaerolineaceae bacterium]HQM65096.1 1-phosphofructokinase family hexose kinase [Anaerolineaceae bacterium]
MIITLTPNPSVDRTLHVPQLRFNEVLRAHDVRVDWGGKGFNVSRALRILNEETLALAWVGGGTGRMMQHGLNQLGIKTDFVWVEEETRINTVAQEDSGEWYIRLNEPGPHIPEDAIQSLLAKAEAYASKKDIWVAAGSLPQDVPADFYTQLIHLLKNKGVRVFFDANGEALRAGLSDPPFLVNPDISETEDFVGFSIHNYDDAKRAVLPFLRLGVEYVALSIDGLGLLLASQQEMMLATPPKVSIRNVTGAGDALMAGMAYGFARGMDLREIARLGAAFSAVAVTTVSLASVKNSDVEAMLPRVEVRTVNVM